MNLTTTLTGLALGVLGALLGYWYGDRNSDPPESASSLTDEVARLNAELATARHEAEAEAAKAADSPAAQLDRAVEAASAQPANHEIEAGAALVDEESGLFSESFFLVALDSRVAAARRHLRPVAMVLLDVVEGLPASEPRQADVEFVSATIIETLREADTASRLRNGYFALLLEDTAENGAIWTIERIRRQLVHEQEGITVWAGIACYPAHAFNADDVISASEAALVSAKEWRQDRIEVAVASD